MLSAFHQLFHHMHVEVEPRGGLLQGHDSEGHGTKSRTGVSNRQPETECGIQIQKARIGDSKHSVSLLCAKSIPQFFRDPIP